ncbi:MAG TPA: hypothetical protein VFZ80_05345, partial [Acidimicrobiia bacterium]
MTSRRLLIWLVAMVLVSAGCRSTTAPTPREHLSAGFRYSIYGPDYNPGPEYWAGVGREMAADFPGAVPGTVWIVGRLDGSGTEMSFPGTSDDPLIRFTDKDLNEEALTLFDQYGFDCWLQVEPGNASVEESIHLMLGRYGHHPCVVGVGVDVEWFRSVDEPDGDAVTDQEARTWLAAAREYHPEYRLFLKHWLTEKMPPTVREGILFIDDSQIFPSLDAMVEEFTRWGRAFAPAPVGFQYGYPSDRPWWRNHADPPAEIGRRILEAVPNAEALYWVDFTAIEVFLPPPEIAAAHAARTSVAPDGAVIGVKIYEVPADLNRAFGRWEDLGITTAFASEAVAGDGAFRMMAEERGIEVFVIVPVFQDPEALEREPELVAITSRGAEAREDWVAFVCPSREPYRTKKAEAVREMVRRLRPDGLSLDFIRHFVFWEKVHPATAHGDIPNACFCPSCVASFSEATGIEIPAGLDGTIAIAEWILDNHGRAWTEWKIGLIDSMAWELVRSAREERPSIEINIHAVPWTRTDFGGAILRTAGQDFASLANYADYLSPMTYAHMVQRPPSWIHSVVVRLAGESSAPILPSIQVKEAYRPGVELSDEEFEQHLREALKPPSRGVVFWSWEA